LRSGVRVIVDDGARPDIAAIEDVEVVRAALRLMLALRCNPYLGYPLREKSNLRPLAQADCRKIKFDRPERGPEARPCYCYRLVHRIEPHEGSPAEVVVMGIGVKPRVYRDATTRAARRLREAARRRRQ
jgi:hypothetical protein